MKDCMNQDNLTAKQSDYAIFLPAISGFYQTFIGKQRVNNDYVDVNRMPAAIQDMEQMNWLNDQKGLFQILLCWETRVDSKLPKVSGKETGKPIQDAPKRKRKES